MRLTLTMKFSEINNMTLMTRRSLMAAGAAAVVFPQPGFALSAPAAQELVTRLIADVNTVISSGKSEAGMIVDLARPSIATPMCPQSRAIALGLMRGPRLHPRWRHIRLRLPTISRPNTDAGSVNSSVVKSRCKVRARSKAGLKSRQRCCCVGGHHCGWIGMCRIGPAGTCSLTSSLKA